jgi:DNA-binding LacI/PurR family transcriptional regulator
MNGRVNIFDIAKEAGVSIATVSRVISGSANVRADTRDKVMRVVNKYHFKPNMIATGLNKRQSRTLGLVLPMADNPFYSKLYIAALQEAQGLGYSIMPYYLARGTMLDQSFVDVLIGKRLDGVVFSGDIATDSSFQSLVLCIRQVQRYMPVMAINPDGGEPRCLTLRSDLAGAIRLALGHLARLGHERIALIGGNGAVRNEHTREYAYQEEMNRLGLGQHIYPYSMGETPSDGEACVARLFSMLGERQRPTALACFNDWMALGAIKQLKRQGLTLPGDIAIAGCDNLFFAPYTDPPLTTVDLRIEDTARIAVQLLVQAQTEPLEPFAQVFEPTLVVRESCGAAVG